MDYKSIAGNALTAFFAQGVSFLVSVVTTLLVPKILGVEQFGYWQLFLFYSSYVGFFHLGLNDGVYLINGGKTRDDLNRASVFSQLLFGIALESIAAGILLLVAYSDLFGQSRSFVVACVAVFTLLKCVAFYFGYLFQAINETKRYSFSCILERVVFFLLLLFLLLARSARFELYVVSYCVSMGCQLVYCAWHGRFIFTDGLLSIEGAAKESLASIRVGSKLMIANIASTLVLGVARALIDAVWGIEAFGQLSLTLSMVNFFLSFVTQAAMVLFPALRQVSEEGLRRFFALSRDLLSLLMPAVYLMYFPIAWLLAAWLPQYADSLVYLPYLLPICVFESKMSICCATYYKVVRKEGELLRLNVVVSIIGAIGALLGAFALHSVHMVILSTVCAIAGRSLWAEHGIARGLDVPASPCMTGGELAIAIVFVISAALLPAFISAPLYAVCYVAWLLLNKTRLQGLIASFR